MRSRVCRCSSRSAPAPNARPAPGASIRVAVARVVDGGIAGEHLLDQLRVGDNHRPPPWQRPDRVHLAGTCGGWRRETESCGSTRDRSAARWGSPARGEAWASCRDRSRAAPARQARGWAAVAGDSTAGLAESTAVLMPVAPCARIVDIGLSTTPLTGDVTSFDVTLFCVSSFGGILHPWRPHRPRTG